MDDYHRFKLGAVFNRLVYFVLLVGKMSTVTLSAVAAGVGSKIIL